MEVEYNGFVGELTKLESTSYSPRLYELFIYEQDKNVVHQFIGVKIEGVKFLTKQ